MSVEELDAATSTGRELTPLPMRQRLYVMMFLQYFVQGSYLPIISVYLQDALGFDSRQLGVFGAALAVGPTVAPFFVGLIVGRHVWTEIVLAFCHLLGGVIMLLLYFQTGFLPVVILGAFYSALYVPSLMLTNSLAFHHLRNRDAEFPGVRLWGTIGFVIPAWVVELYFLHGLSGDELNIRRGVVLLLAGGAGVLMAAYSLTLPHTPPAKSDKKDLAPGKVLAGLRHRDFLTLVLVSFIVAVSHKFFFVWNSPFLRDVLKQGGVTGAWEQRISSIGQVFEVAVMAVLGLMVLKLGFKRTMLIGALAYMARCLIFAFAITADGEGAFPAVMSLVCAGQALHGLCFGCFLAAAYMYVDRISPPDVRGSMQNFYGTFVIGVGMFLGGFVSGQIGESFTRPASEATWRLALGIESQAGIVRFVDQATNVEMMRDWVGIWLAGTLIAAFAAAAFAITFPRKPTDIATAEAG